MKFLVATFCAALFTSVVYAQQNATQPTGETTTNDVDRYTAMFNEADANGDSRLNPQEAEAIGLVGDSFVQLDTDGDGALSLDEFLALLSAGAGQRGE